MGVSSCSLLPHSGQRQKVVKVNENPGQGRNGKETTFDQRVYICGPRTISHRHVEGQ